MLLDMIGTSVLASGHWHGAVAILESVSAAYALRLSLGYAAGLLRLGSTWVNACYAHSLSQLTRYHYAWPPASVYIMLQQLILKKYTTPVPWI